MNATQPRYGFATASYAAFPPVVQVALVCGVCPAGCIYCPLGRKNHGELATELARELEVRYFDPALFRRLAGEIAGHRGTILRVHGRGEPMCHPGYFEMIAGAADLGVTVTSFTNGAYLLANVERVLDSGLAMLEGSADAADAEHYTEWRRNRFFDAIVAGGRRLREHRAERSARRPAVVVSAVDHPAFRPHRAAFERFWAPLADGQHTLKVTVKDAAGNSSVVLDDAISTHNAPVNTAPPSILAPAQTTAGSAVAAQAGSWSAPAGAGTISYSYQWQSCGSEGASCTAIAGATTAMYNAVAGDAGRTLRVIVSAADSDGSTSTVSAASGPIAGSPGAPSSPDAAPASAESDVGNGVGASESAELQLSGKGTIARAFARRALKIGGRLLNGRRQPIAGAQLQVLEQPAGSSAAHVIGQVGTSSAGAFTASVAAGPSRVIEIAYRAFSADAGYAAAGYVRESVAAGVRLSVTPRATASTGRIVLSGSVQGPVPAAGALVELLVRYRGHWEPFRTPHTTAAGRFRVIYQFEGAVGRFPFMARVPAGQAGLPYATGRSAAVRVLTG